MQASGAFDRFRALPVWRAAPIVGGLLGDAGRYLLASGLVIGLRAAADANPVTRLVTADRGLMSGTATAPQIAWVLAAAVAFTVVFAPLALRLYRARQ
jgi:ABC-2 type transport system permease protein